MYLHCADEEMYLKKLNILYKGTQKVAGQKNQSQVYQTAMPIF